jgi:MspA protein
MLNRFAILAVICLSIPIATAPLTAADPNADPPLIPVADSAPPPPDGAVLSGDPDIVTTPDGWTLTVSARNETQVNVPPLTTALSSREYLVGGTFTGSVTGKGSSKPTGGTLEAGYQIGCGIILDRVEPQATLGFTPSFGAAGFSGFSDADSAGAEVELFPGKVVTVPVTTAKFKDTNSRVSITSFRINIDGCVGQSSLRSYATLTSTTADTDDVVSYTGVTMAV